MSAASAILAHIARAAHLAPVDAVSLRLELSLAQVELRALLHLTSCPDCEQEFPALEMVNVLEGKPYDDLQEEEPIQLVCRQCAAKEEARMVRPALALVPWGEEGT